MNSKPNAETLSFTAKKGLIHEAPKQKRKSNLRPTFLEAKGLGCLWDKAEAWGAWGKVIRKMCSNHHPVQS